MKANLFLLFFALTSGAAFSQNYNVVLRSQLQYPGQTLANICGYVDSLGNEYALCGASDGMSIVNVTDPDSIWEVMQIPHPNLYPANKKWKEIKVYKNYAYIVSESGGGLQIVDLRDLPDTSNIPVKLYAGDGAINSLLNRVHALHVDTAKGFIYLYGMTNLATGGALAIDLADPWNPVYAGQYANYEYIHDGYVDNDTLYAANMFEGYFSVIDFSDKANPYVLGSANIPFGWSHNTWPSADKKTLFTTSETSGAFLTSYDISDMSNITLLDTLHTNDPAAVIHNTHIINDYAVSSWYTEGFTIVDVSRPWNMIEVGKYDTYSPPIGGFNGAWGVYPFLPSGTILVSNIGEGLFVLTPTYQRACYLEGNVKDSLTQINLGNVNVQLISTTQSDLSDAIGMYATGTGSAGTYNVQFSKTGYQTKIVNNVSLANGALTVLDVELVPDGIGINSPEKFPVMLTILGANPFRSDCTIEFTAQFAEEAWLEITDATGRLVETKKVIAGSSSMPVGADYRAGIYYAYIKTSCLSSVPLKLVKLN